MAGERIAGAIRVLTWNVHACVGTDGRFDVARVAAVIRGLEPDIAAIQEVDSRDHVAGALDTFDCLRREVGAYAAEAKTIAGEGGEFGHMIASRWPLLESAVHDVSSPRRQPRQIIEATIETPAGPVRVVAAHLGLRRGERRRQIHALREIVERGPNLPLLLMGDFNEWHRRGAAHRALADIVGIGPTPATFPSALPVLPLDKITCRPIGSILRLWTVRAARAASDHLPLVADVRWPEARAEALPARREAAPASPAAGRLTALVRRSRATALSIMRAGPREPA